jgi:hypothetical protein
MCHYDACYSFWICFSAHSCCWHNFGCRDFYCVKHIAPAGVAGVLAGSAPFYYIREYGAVIDLIVGLALKAIFGFVFLYVSLKYILLYFGIHI